MSASTERIMSRTLSRFLSSCSCKSTKTAYSRQLSSGNTQNVKPKKRSRLRLVTAAVIGGTTLYFIGRKTMLIKDKETETSHKISDAEGLPKVADDFSLVLELLDNIVYSYKYSKF